MNENRICVVSLIGKSQLLQNQTKAWKLNVLLKQNYFQVSNKNNDLKFGINILVVKFILKSDTEQSESYHHELMKKVLKKSKSLNDEKNEPNDVDDETKSESKEINEESENQPNDEETVCSVPLVLEIPISKIWCIYVLLTLIYCYF